MDDLEFGKKPDEFKNESSEFSNNDKFKYSNKPLEEKPAEEKQVSLNKKIKKVMMLVASVVCVNAVASSAATQPNNDADASIYGVYEVDGWEEIEPVMHDLYYDIIESDNEYDYFEIMKNYGPLFFEKKDASDDYHMNSSKRYLKYNLEDGLLYNYKELNSNDTYIGLGVYGEGDRENMQFCLSLVDPDGEINGLDKRYFFFLLVYEKEIHLSCLTGNFDKSYNSENAVFYDMSYYELDEDDYTYNYHCSKLEGKMTNLIFVDQVVYSYCYDNEFTSAYKEIESYKLTERDDIVNIKVVNSYEDRNEIGYYLVPTEGMHNGEEMKYYDYTNGFGVATYLYENEEIYNYISDENVEMTEDIYKKLVISSDATPCIMLYDLFYETCENKTIQFQIER